MDKTIKIWRNISPFNEAKTLIHKGGVSNMIIQITSITGIYTHNDISEMIELPNMFVAVSSVSKGTPIVIIEQNKYCIVKVIKIQNTRQVHLHYVY